MKDDEMKKIYEADPDDWIPYTNNRGFWEKAPQSPALIMWECNHQLIAKKDELIAEAVIANPDVEVEYQMSTQKRKHTLEGKNFFKYYNEKQTYKLKETKPIQINSMNDLNDLPLTSESMPKIEYNNKNLMKHGKEDKPRYLKRYVLSYSIPDAPQQVIRFSSYTRITNISVTGASDLELREEG